MVDVLSDDPNAGVYNIIAVKGKSFRRVLTWTDANGNPINLTGATAELKVRQIDPPNLRSTEYTYYTPVISLSSSAGDITFDTTAGIVNVYADAVTMDVAVGRYYYDLEITISSEVYSLVRGTFNVVVEATF